MASSTGVSSSADNPPHHPVLPTRIVGIGASAGGLVALEQFLGNTPPDSGMAYIVVQHLDPTQKALLPELLQRVTTMPVHEVVQGMRIEPDSVYVIPPNTELSVVNGILKLAAPTEPRGMRLPINVLFSSLASALNESAIAVVLSGMGTDGTLGLQAIKSVGGLTWWRIPRLHSSIQCRKVPSPQAVPTSSRHPGNYLPASLLSLPG